MLAAKYRNAIGILLYSFWRFYGKMANVNQQERTPLERWLDANRNAPDLDASLRLLLGHLFQGIFCRSNPEFAVFSPEKALSLVQRLPRELFPENLGGWLAHPERFALDIVHFCEKYRDFKLPESVEIAPFLTGAVDLRGVRCPTASIRARLVLAGMSPDDEVALLVDDGEPVENVPRAMLEDGNLVISRKKKENYWILQVRKRELTV